MGRKPISDTAKETVLAIRMSLAERELMNAAAAEAGKTVSTWARDLLVQHATPAKLPKKPARKK